MTRSLLRLLVSSPRLAIVVLGGSLTLTSLSQAQVPTPQLTTVFPPGAKAGSRVEVRVGGADLDEARQLVFSHPGIQATPQKSPPTEFERAKLVANAFAVQVAGDVPPGSYDVRVVGRFGVSNPRTFVVGSRAEANDPGGNAQPDKASALPLDQVLNGAVDANQVDYFKVTLAAGQRVIIRCSAKDIDSRLDGSLVLFDPQGKEIARARGFGTRDPQLDVTATAAGEYRLAVRDFTYRGGGEYFYRLVAQTSPVIDWIYPPSGLAGSNEEYTIYGRNLPQGQPAGGLTLQGQPLQKMTVRIALPASDDSRLGLAGRATSNAALLDGTAYRLPNGDPFPIYYAKGTVIREAEPNDQATQATPLVVPCEVVGQFATAGDLDTFSFAARKGEVFNIETYCHRLGLEADPLLVVQKVKKNDKGEETVQEIAQVDDPGDRAGKVGSEFDTSTDDPEYTLTADEDATYRLVLRDQLGENRADPRFVYRLAIHRGEPDFRMVAYASPVISPANANAVTIGGAVVRPGGTSAIEVRLDRRYGFTGDVQVEVQGLPAGVTCPPITLSGSAATATLILTAEESAADWSGPIRVVGRGMLRGVEIVRQARSGVAVWGAANRQQEYVPYRLAQDLTLAVAGRDKYPVTARTAEDKVYETARGGTIEIPIKVTRRFEFKDDLTLAPANAPNEIKPANLVVKGADAEGKLQFSAANANAKPGEYTFYLRADGKFKHQRNPDAVAEAEQEQKSVTAALAAVTESNKKLVVTMTEAVSAVQAAAVAVKKLGQDRIAAEQEAQAAAAKATQAEAALKSAKEAAAKSTTDTALAAAATAAEKAKAEADAAKAAAEQKRDAAAKALAEAQAAAKKADEGKAAAEKAATAGEAQVKRLDEAKKAADKRVADAQAANKPKDLQFAVITSPIRVRIVESALHISAATPPLLKAEGKIQLPVKVERRYGFDDQVEVTLEVPGGLKGITTGKLTLPKGQSEGQLEITATREAPVGEHALTLRVKGTWNKIENQSSQTIPLTIVPSP